MQCPACERQLRAVEVAGTEFDVCQDGCGGIWFDQYELHKVDEFHEEMGVELMEQARKDPDVAVVDDPEHRDCPRCDNWKLMRRHFCHLKEVLIDECAKCGGVWLDHGELARIREQFADNEERRQAAREWCRTQLKSQVNVERREAPAKAQPAGMVGRILKLFIPC